MAFEKIYFLLGEETNLRILRENPKWLLFKKYKEPMRLWFSGKKEILKILRSQIQISSYVNLFICRIIY